MYNRDQRGSRDTFVDESKDIITAINILKVTDGILLAWSME